MPSLVLVELFIPGLFFFLHVLNVREIENMLCGPTGSIDG